MRIINQKIKFCFSNVFFERKKPILFVPLLFVRKLVQQEIAFMCLGKQQAEIYSIH